MRRSALDRLAIQLDDLALFRRADLDHVAEVFGVVVVEALGVVGVEDLVADDVADLLAGHAAVHARRDDHLDVLDAVIGERLEDDGEHALAHVGPAHRRQRQRDVVDADDDLHPGTELRVERVRVVRMVDRVADRGLDVLQRRERLPSDRCSACRAAGRPRRGGRRRRWCAERSCDRG